MRDKKNVETEGARETEQNKNDGRWRSTKKHGLVCVNYAKTMFLTRAQISIWYSSRPPSLKEIIKIKKHQTSNWGTQERTYEVVPESYFALSTHSARSARRKEKVIKNAVGTFATHTTPATVIFFAGRRLHYHSIPTARVHQTRVKKKLWKKKVHQRPYLLARVSKIRTDRAFHVASQTRRTTLPRAKQPIELRPP